MKTIRLEDDTLRIYLAGLEKISDENDIWFYISHIMPTRTWWNSCAWQTFANETPNFLRFSLGETVKSRTE